MNRRDIILGSAGFVGASNILPINRALASAADTVDPSSWFARARFGMFIHWGLYSQIAGEWYGKHFYGISEWIMRRAKIPVCQYENVARNFNPVNYSAASWVRVAKRAGVKYLVITAKHLDGFAMYASRVNKFNIVDATPYNRDPMHELCNVARDKGLKIGFYYSQFQDWHEKDAGGNTWDFTSDKTEFSRYLKTKAMPQVSELLSNYGPISVIWFDTAEHISMQDSQALYDLVKSHQPNCLVNTRVGNGLGDFTTFGDAEVPSRVQTGTNWEAIFMHNDSWGYSKFDYNFKSKSEVLNLMIEVASKGGNFMLNVGPKGDGSLPEKSIEVFAEVGDWLNRYGESIYGTEGVDLCPVGWGVATRRQGRIYLHLINTPADGKLLVPCFSGGIDRIHYMNGNELTWQIKGSDLFIQIDRLHEFTEPTVIEIDTPDGALFTPGYSAIVSRQYSKASITPMQAELNGHAKIKSISYYQYFGDWKHFDAIEGINNAESYIYWSLRFAEPGAYRIALEYAADSVSAESEGYVSFADERFPFQVLYTGEICAERPVSFIIHNIADVVIANEGIYLMKIGRIGSGGNLFHLKNVIISPYS